MAVGALLLRDLEYDANVCKKIKSDEADLRALPSLRAEPVGRDKTGNCHWAFRGEREYRYAPQRVWVQQSPDHDVQQKPSWGYYGDATAVAALCRHLDRNDESEALLREAHKAFPDPEVAAHLGEVLWVQGRQFEARDVWRDGLSRVPDHPIILEALKRLGAELP